MESYEIGPGSIISLNLRLRGGATSKGQQSGDKGKKLHLSNNPREGYPTKTFYRAAEIQGPLQIKAAIYPGHI